METILLELEPVTVETVGKLIRTSMEEAMKLGTATVALSVIGGQYYYYYVPIAQDPWVRRDWESRQLSLTADEAVDYALKCITDEMVDRIWRQREYWGKEASGEYKVKVYYHPKLV